MVYQGKIEKLAWHFGRTVRLGHGIKPRCGSSNPHSAVAHRNNHGTRRGFLPRGLYDARPQACVDSLRSAVTGRHPTNLNGGGHMRLCRKMLRERQLCGGPYHRLCMLRVSCSSAAATTRKKSPPQPCRSQTDAERLRKFSKALAWFWMVFTPGRAAFEFIQDFGSGFHTCFSSKLIPQVFHQLKAFKPAKLCNGLQC